MFLNQQPSAENKMTAHMYVGHHAHRERGCPQDFPCATKSINPADGKANSRDTKAPDKIDLGWIRGMQTEWANRPDDFLTVHAQAMEDAHHKQQKHNDREAHKVHNTHRAMQQLGDVHEAHKNAHLGNLERARAELSVAMIKAKHAELDRDTAKADAAKLQRERDQLLEKASVALDPQARDAAKVTASRLDELAQKRAADASSASAVADVAAATMHAKAADAKAAAAAAVSVATAAVQSTSVAAAKSDVVEKQLATKVEDKRVEEGDLRAKQLAAERDRDAAAAAHAQVAAVSSGAVVAAAKDKVDKATQELEEVKQKREGVKDELLTLTKSHEAQKVVVEQQKTKVVEASAQADAANAIKKVVTDHIDATTTGVPAKRESVLSTPNDATRNQSAPFKFDDTWHVLRSETLRTCSYSRDDTLIVCKMTKDDTCPSEFNSSCTYLKPATLDAQNAK